MPTEEEVRVGLGVDEVAQRSPPRGARRELAGQAAQQAELASFQRRVELSRVAAAH